jgi:hypothetical protein
MTSAANPTELVADLENGRGHPNESLKWKAQSTSLEPASRVEVPQYTSYRRKYLYRRAR